VMTNSGGGRPNAATCAMSSTASSVVSSARSRAGRAEARQCRHASGQACVASQITMNGRSATGCRGTRTPRPVAPGAPLVPGPGDVRFGTLMRLACGRGDRQGRWTRPVGTKVPRTLRATRHGHRSPTPGTCDLIRQGPFSPAPRPVATGTLETVTSALLVVVGCVLLVAGAGMMARASAGRRQIRRELSDQKIVFPDADHLPPGLTRHACTQVRTGEQARAFADLIGANVARATKGRTYAEIAEVLHAGGGADEQLARMRETAFVGQALRASLLGAYQAWQLTLLVLSLGALLAVIGLVFLVMAVT
jgi:hypothetical protein